MASFDVDADGNAGVGQHQRHIVNQALYVATLLLHLYQHPNIQHDIRNIDNT